MNLIDVEEGLSLVKNRRLDFGNESILLNHATGRILAESIYADRALPPYHRVTMDGIAIQYAAFNKGQNKFTIEGIAAAGAVQKTLQSNNNCMEVMTGSVLPKNTDTVIRYEDLEIENNIAKILNDKINPKQNVHFAGSDVSKNELLLTFGTKLNSADIGISASIGKAKILVRKNPKVCVISTGDELIDVDQIPQEHQIRKSNIFAIQSFLKSYHIDADLFHFIDDPTLIEDNLKIFLEDYDLIVLSGGVSKGKFDYIPNVLESLGVTKLFHGVRQRPGKPLFFGTKNKTVVFGLPGNPVSSIIGAHKFIGFWLDHCYKLKRNKKIAQLSEDFTFKPDLHRFLPVTLEYSNSGQLLAKPIKGNGSGDFISLKDANGILELPRGKELFAKGESYSFIPMA